MRAVVTCECCGFRQAVARSIARPERFFVVCHECEGVLQVEVTAEAIRTAELIAASRTGHSTAAR